MTIGQRIRQKRKEMNMSADELAARIGKDRSTIFRYEKGDIENLPIDILLPIAKALDTSPSFLMGWVDEDTGEKNSAIAGATKRMMNDPRFCNVVLKLDKLSAEKFIHVEQLILMIGEE